MSSPYRIALLGRTAEAILSMPSAGVLRVAIDGVDGAGKTVFADELAEVIEGMGRTTIRASVDSFHNPRAVRYRRGARSPRGFFLDSYNYSRLRTLLLDPLAPGGSGRYRVAMFDHRSDSERFSSELQAPPGSILLLDGIFLHRPELRSCWDYSIFLRVGFHRSIARCAGRDGCSADPLAAENRRYVVGQQLYLRSCAPERCATLVIDNNDLSAPWVVGDECVGTVRPR